jgi:hypothetical protein
VAGLLIYFAYGYRHSIMARAFWRQQPGNEALPDEAYYRSGEYRGRTVISLGFCAAAAAIVLSLFAVTEARWQQGTLRGRFDFEPETVVWLARGFAAFVVLMLLMTVVEWKRARSAAAG